MEVINLIINILSLLATISVSVAIFWLQRRHENEVEKQEDLRRKEAIIEAAKIFIIDNQEDIHLLPLCVMAASVNPHKNHIRPLYIHFNKCSEELQKEILRQENIPLVIESSCNWEVEAFKKFEEDCEKYKMGKPYWWEGYGATFLHDSIYYMQNDLGLGNINKYVFDVPSLEKIVFPNHKHELTSYIDEYLKYILKDKKDTADKLELLPQKPPMDLLREKFKFVSCDTKILNFWLMEYIISACVAFCRHGLIDDIEAEWREIYIREDELETYEDMYYETLLMLYIAYGPKVN